MSHRIMTLVDRLLTTTWVILLIQHQVKFTLPGHLFTHFGFPECPCCLECNIYSRHCYVYVYGLVILDKRMPHGYFFPNTYYKIHSNLDKRVESSNYDCSSICCSLTNHTCCWYLRKVWYGA